jgi:hypothetical protein
MWSLDKCERHLTQGQVQRGNPAPEQLFVQYLDSAVGDLIYGLAKTFGDYFWLRANLLC